MTLLLEMGRERIETEEWRKKILEKIKETKKIYQFIKDANESE